MVYLLLLALRCYWLLLYVLVLSCSLLLLYADFS